MSSCNSLERLNVDQVLRFADKDNLLLQVVGGGRRMSNLTGYVLGVLASK